MLQFSRLVYKSNFAKKIQNKNGLRCARSNQVSIVMAHEYEYTD